MQARSLILLLPLTACYAELGTGYYPSVHTTAQTSPTATSSSGGGWLGMFKLGFYLDVPAKVLRSAVGIGFAPVAADGAAPPQAPAQLSAEGVEFRVDVGLPKVFFDGFLKPRITVAYNHILDAKVTMAPSATDVTAKASGHTLFAGATMSVGDSGAGAMLSLGVQNEHVSSVRDDGGLVVPVDSSGTGLVARVMVMWTPTGQYMRHYHPSECKLVLTNCVKGADGQNHCDDHYECDQHIHVDAD